MQFMVIEKFKPGKVTEMYRRFDEKGRQLPEAVSYINSWISEDISTCFQVMETESPEKLQEWIRCWDDLVDFEVIPVISSAEARLKAFSLEK